MDRIEEIKLFLVEDCGLGSEVGAKDSIFADRLIDSLGVLSLMTFLTEKYSVELSPFEVGIEDFDTLEKIDKLIGDKL